MPVTLATVRRRRGKSWSSDEARKFLESARADEDPIYAAYALVLVVGLRKGEALGLTWADVDLDTGELTVGRQLQRVRGQLLHRDTKTQASDATLPLYPQARPFLGGQLALQPFSARSIWLVTTA